MAHIVKQVTRPGAQRRATGLDRPLECSGIGHEIVGGGDRLGELHQTESGAISTRLVETNFVDRRHDRIAECEIRLDERLPGASLPCRIGEAAILGIRRAVRSAREDGQLFGSESERMLGHHRRAANQRAGEAANGVELLASVEPNEAETSQAEHVLNDLVVRRGVVRTRHFGYLLETVHASCERRKAKA